MRIKDPNGDEQDPKAPAGEEDPYGQQSLTPAPATAPQTATAPKSGARDYSSWLGGTGTAAQGAGSVLGATVQPAMNPTGVGTAVPPQGASLGAVVKPVVTEGYGATQGQYVTPGGSNSSGQFVNFDRYLDANRDAAQAGGAKMAGGVAASAQAAQNAVQGAYGSFSQSVKDGTPLDYNGGQVNTAEADSVGVKRQGLQSAPRLGVDGKPVPVAPGGTPITGDMSLAEAQAGAARGYTGPQHANALNALGKQVSKAQSDVNAFGKRGGLEGLIQRGNADETSGGSAMDAALYGATNGKAFSDLQKKWGGLEKSYQGLVGSAEGEARDGRLQAEASQAGYGGAVKTYEKNASDRLRAEEDKRLSDAKASDQKRKYKEDLARDYATYQNSQHPSENSRLGQTGFNFRQYRNSKAGRDPNDNGPNEDLSEYGY